MKKKNLFKKYIYIFLVILYVCNISIIAVGCGGTSRLFFEKEYSIIWMNGDVPIKVSTTKYGTPIIPPEDPVPPKATAQYTYEFKGWTQFEYFKQIEGVNSFNDIIKLQRSFGYPDQIKFVSSKTGESILQNEDIISAACVDYGEGYQVLVSLTPTGGEKFQQAIIDNLFSTIDMYCVTFEGTEYLISSIYIGTYIEGRKFYITGLGTRYDAEKVAMQIHNSNISFDNIEVISNFGKVYKNTTFYALYTRTANK
jgi:hypothetical protein